MITTIHILHSLDLYEIRYSGTTIHSIQKFYNGGGSGPYLSFKNLQPDVQDKIVKVIQKKLKPR